MANPTGGPPPAKLDLDALLQRQGRLRALIYLDSVIAELDLATRLGISPMLTYYRQRRAALAFELGISDGAIELGFGHAAMRGPLQVPPK